MSTTWDLSPEDALELPLDELALRVLEHYRDSGGWNWGNWMRARAEQYGSRSLALPALAEAWAWINGKALVARKFDQPAMDSVSVTRSGNEALERGLPWLRAVQRLDVSLTPVLEARARPLFLRGDFEAAVFVAMKEVEVATRTLSRLDNNLHGVKLMQEAFRPPRSPGEQAGPLHTQDADQGEAVALMELFKGAIGTFKNPSSHRRVDITDPTEAAEIILLADLLLRLLAKIEPPQ